MVVTSSNTMQMRCAFATPFCSTSAFCFLITRSIWGIIVAMLVNCWFLGTFRLFHVSSECTVAPTK